LLESVEEALAAKVIEELPQTMSRYQFAHVLIQNTLAHELSAARRARLHRRIGETLEEQYKGAAEAHAAELAYHFAQVLTATGIQKLVHYSLLAGERALNSYAHEEAVVYFQRGLAAKEGQPVDSDTAALLFGLGRAQAATLEQHEMQDAVASLSRAFDYYAEVGDLPRAAAVAGCALRSHAGQRIGAIRLVARALDLVPRDSPEAGSLLAQYGLILGMENGDYNGAQQAFGQALAIAQREQDLALEMRTLASASDVDYYHLHYQESLEKSLSAIKLSQSIDDPVSLAGAYLSATHCLDRSGDLAGARRYGAAMLAVAEKLRDRNRLAVALRNNGILAWQVGDLPAARDFYDRALAIAPTQSNILSNQALIEYELGNFSQGETHLQRLLEVITWHQPGPSWAYAEPALVIPMIARITGVAERLDIAKSAATTVVSSLSAAARIALAARASLALIAVLTGDVAAAGEQYAALKPARGTTLTACLAVDRLLGLAAQTMGQLDEAAEHFEDAFSFCWKGGQRPELAWTCHDYTEALLQRNRPGDRTRAMSLLDEALSISSELGMRPLMVQVVALKEQAGSHPAEVPTYPSGLTEREVEVLLLIALGKSNREIGEQLVITEGTARRHVSNIYNKIGAANRAEATGYTLRMGLLSLDEVPSTTAGADTGSA
jgi:DNA-binding CsgD family transcriptional regulator/Tfp pilus assembly protein PilF